MVTVPHIRVPKTKVVASQELSTKSLRARDYVFSPKAVAKKVVDDLFRMVPVLNRQSPALKLHHQEIEARLEEAFAAGVEAGKAQFARMM